jgi:hypothetical protein
MPQTHCTMCVIHMETSSVPAFIWGGKRCFSRALYAICDAANTLYFVRYPYGDVIGAGIHLGRKEMFTCVICDM